MGALPGSDPQITASYKENPMSLGVLNNLSAVYAENNLNNSNNSLNTVLQQLSSGSKINSGADDAAGLSLVDGLQANQMALTQSETNATEGVGFLQVADGALSQVTSLLNRAVTLATEASNGTLNSSQDTAANQEYQSILSEINNIGTTTTYNDSAVFDSNTNIYTGDSSSVGSSVDDLNIRSLSSSNIGDTGGVMAYSSGANNAFIDLSHGGTLAQASNELSASGTTTVDVEYMQTGASGAVTDAEATISVGGTTGFANTAQGMINAINGAGLGLTATFTTASQAGSAAVTYANANSGSGADTGIEISGVGAGVAAGTTPGQVGTLSINVSGDNGDTLGGTLNVTDSSGAKHTVTLGTTGTTDTLANLAATINAEGWGITATYAAAGGASSDGGLTFTSASSLASVSVGTALSDATDGTDTPTYASDTYYTAGIATPVFASHGIADTATGQSAVANIASDTNGTGGTATISYSDSAGESLSSSDLSNQTDAEAALTALNSAITDVAAQDGYIGAQINTLNAVSSVLSTQQENVQSAQNAVQATDYAMASSNMSKYEILSQTGISALAQANSMQQEVTKLLQ
jgi:flagellin